MWMDMVSKRELRKQLQTVAGDPAMEDDATLRALLFSPLLLFADRVFAFVPLPTEPDISPLLSDLSIALPLCHPDGTMEFHAVPNDWKAHVRYGKFGVGEPIDGENVAPTENSVILVPGVAFTPEGARLGHGKGYYDRYLAAHPGVITIGVCRTHQLVTELPEDPWDLRVTHVVAGGVFVR
jgi:5-formyltetrahydrofolate cyclo-ligase